MIENFLLKKLLDPTLKKVLDPISGFFLRHAKRLMRRSKSSSYSDTEYAGSNDLSLLTSYLSKFLTYACGREKELQSVMDFIDSHQSGRILVEGPSGYGKTTFVAQLQRQLDLRGIKYVWHLFSRALNPDPSLDSSRFVANLAEQFAWFRGEDVTKINNYRNFLVDALRSPPESLVVIIDALDETDPRFLSKFIPENLERGLKIVVTARTLGDDKLLVSGGFARNRLAGSVVLQALQESDLEAIAADHGLAAALVSQIIETTSGDPFYVRFVLEDILSRDERTFAPSSWAPIGLEEYLDNQFRQLSEGSESETQAKMATQIVFSPIPIPKSELISIIDGLSPMNFDRTFQPIRRFFVSTDRGYVVCHSRFKDYFLRKLQA